MMMMWFVCDFKCLFSTCKKHETKKRVDDKSAKQSGTKPRTNRARPSNVKVKGVRWTAAWPHERRWNQWKMTSQPKSNPKVKRQHWAVNGNWEGGGKQKKMKNEAACSKWQSVMCATKRKEIEPNKATKNQCVGQTTNQSEKQKWKR